MRRLSLLLALAVAQALYADAPLSLARYGVAAVGGAPLVASNGSDFVIVWSSNNHIRILQPSVRRGGGLPIATPIGDDGGENALPPSIAWSGSRFALVYNLSTGPSVTMLDGDGNVVTAPRLLENNANIAPTAPAVGWDGKHFLVVYRLTRELQTLYSRLLDGDGNPIGSPIKILAGSNQVYNDTLRVASNGNGFMIVDTNSLVGFIAVDSDGKVIRQNFPDAPFGFDSAIATDGHDYFVTWRRFGTPQQLVGQIIASDGTLRGTVQTIAASPTAVPSVAWNGSSYVVVYNDGGDIRIRHVASNGTPFGADTLAVRGTGAVSAPAVASTGHHDVIAFEDMRPKLADFPYSGGAVRAMSLFPNDTVTPLAGLGVDAVASIGAADHDRVAAAANRFGTLLVWRERIGASLVHRIARLSLDNQWLNADGTELRAQPDSQVAVATNGDLFLLGWIEQGRVRITRVDRNGALIDASPITLLEPRPSTFGGNSIAIASIGSSFVVIYPDASQLAATRVDAGDGHVIDTRIIRPQIGYDTAAAPAARFNGETLVVAYVRTSPCSDSYENPCVVGERAEAIVLGANLQPKMPFPIVFDDTDGIAGPPSVEWNGTRFVVAYADFFDARAFTLDANARIVGKASLVGTKLSDFHRFRSTAIALDRGLFRIFTSEETQEFVVSARAVTEVALDADANRVEPPNRRSIICDFDAPAAAGPLAFYAARINDAPFYGAKRILALAPPRSLDAPSSLQLTQRADGRLLITWSYAANTAGAFRIEAREGTGAFHEIAMTNGDARSAVVDVPSGATVRVRAWSVGGMSDYASVIDSLR